MLKLRNLESFPHLLLFAFLLGRRTRSPLLSRSFSISESFAFFPLPSDKTQNRLVLISPTTYIRSGRARTCRAAPTQYISRHPFLFRLVHPFIICIRFCRPVPVGPCFVGPLEAHVSIFLVPARTPLPPPPPPPPRRQVTALVVEQNRSATERKTT